MSNIFLLEDDKNLNRGISITLQKEGYSVFSAHSISEAEKIINEEDFSLAICDITLPEGNGMDIGRRIREKSSCYLMYLTALDREIDIVSGYDSGADDYMTKPFSLMVLVSKVNAIMNRMKGSRERVLITGEFEIRTEETQVYKNGVPVNLSRKEYQLLRYLVDNAGHIVSKEKILEHIWEIDGQFIDDNTVTVNISRLKSRLETDCISNVRGLGYIWTEKVIGK